MNPSNKTLTSWVILIALALVWGSSFILIKKALNYFDAVEVGILRVTITFLFLAPLALNKIRKISRTHMIRLIVSGSIGSLIPAVLFAVAQTQINSGLAGILNALTPLFTLILGLLFFKATTKWYNIIGVLIGMSGAVGLIYVSSAGGFVFNLKYASLIMFATICYGFNVNYIKLNLKDLNSLTITVFTFFYIGIPCLIYVLAFSAIPYKLLHQEGAMVGFGYLSILSIAGTGLALVAFNSLIKVSSPLFASSVTYMIPVVAILWGIVDGETFKAIYLLWFLLIVIGVILVNVHPRRMYNFGSLIFFRPKNPGH